MLGRWERLRLAQWEWLALEDRGRGLRKRNEWNREKSSKEAPCVECHSATRILCAYVCQNTPTSLQGLGFVCI